MSERARKLLDRGSPAELLERLKVDSNGLLDELVAAEDNPIVHYLETASPEELRTLDELAELDRKYGNQPTPRE